MSIELKVPVLPESVSDATIASWHKKAGDAVARDENLVDLETDKVVLEVPSPVDGVLKEIRHEVGDTVNGEQVIAIIEGKGATEIRRMFDKMLGDTANIPAAELTRAQAFDLIRSIAETAPVQAQSLRSELGAAWDYAIDS